MDGEQSRNRIHSREGTIISVLIDGERDDIPRNEHRRQWKIIPLLLVGR